MSNNKIKQKTQIIVNIEIESRCMDGPIVWLYRRKKILNFSDNQWNSSESFFFVFILYTVFLFYLSYLIVKMRRQSQYRSKCVVNQTTWFHFSIFCFCGFRFSRECVSVFFFLHFRLPFAWAHKE